MKWNNWLLPGFLACGLGAVYVLPKAGDTAQSAVKLQLPTSMGGWMFQNSQASEEEIKILGPDTEFAKALCRSARSGEETPEGYLVADYIDLSIVLSGNDLNSSIHRPERCMPAQGHVITSSKDVLLKVSNGHEFQAKRLQSLRSVPGKEKGSVAAQIKCVTYYFFVGHDRITNDHLQRTLIDMKDRLVHGLDQRWSYVSATMMYGQLPWIEKEVTEAEADEKLKVFLTRFSDSQIIWTQLKQ
jgi:hypothetical protein